MKLAKLAFMYGGDFVKNPNAVIKCWEIVYRVNIRSTDLYVTW